MTVLLALYPRLPTVRLVGSDIAHAVPLTFVAGFGHWMIGGVDWTLLFSLLVGSLPGIAIGSHLAARVPEQLPPSGACDDDGCRGSETLDITDSVQEQMSNPNGFTPPAKPGRGRIYNSITQTIGDTPLVRLDRLRRSKASRPTCSPSSNSSIRSRASRTASASA